jgi:hypothetical protein
MPPTVQKSPPVCQASAIASRRISARTAFLSLPNTHGSRPAWWISEPWLPSVSIRPAAFTRDRAPDKSSFASDRSQGPAFGIQGPNTIKSLPRAGTASCFHKAEMLPYLRLPVAMRKDRVVRICPPSRAGRSNHTEAGRGSAAVQSCIADSTAGGSGRGLAFVGPGASAFDQVPIGATSRVHRTSAPPTQMQCEITPSWPARATIALI